MTEHEGYLTTSTGLMKGLYRDETVMRHNRLWVWFKFDTDKNWTLQCPSQIVVDIDW